MEHRLAIVWCKFRPLGYERVYLPLCENGRYTLSYQMGRLAGHHKYTGSCHGPDKKQNTVICGCWPTYFRVVISQITGEAKMNFF